jgi:heme A synthase
MISKQNPPLKDGFLIAVVLVLVLGSLVLAIIDESSRPAFIDLAKVGVSGLIGWMMPRT